MSLIQFTAKRIFPNFHSLKINRVISFCNIFMEWPS